MGNDTMHSFDVTIHHRTAAAILVSLNDADNEDTHWLPLSRVDVREDDGSSATVYVPEWLAKAKGIL